MRSIMVECFKLNRETLKGGKRTVFRVLDFTKNKQGQNITKLIVRKCCPRSRVYEKGYTVWSLSKIRKVWECIYSEIW